MTTTEPSAGKFGANSWLVEEMYEQFRSDPGSVSEAWQEFFEDYKTIAPPKAPAAAAAPVAAVVPVANSAAPATPPAATAAPAAAHGARTAAAGFH